MSTQQLLGGSVFAPGQTAGQTAGSIIGAAIGAYVGGPAGAFYGYKISAEISGFNDPAPDERQHRTVAEHLGEEGSQV